jgi:hypothetical protein
VSFEDLVGLEPRLPLQALAVSTLGTIKMVIRLIHTAP